MERHRVLSDARRCRLDSAEMRLSEPARRLCTWLLKENPDERPSAMELAASTDLAALGAKAPKEAKSEPAAPIE
jgi:hypothetical protein